MFLKIKKIHMIGIGGSGMSGIAEILINSGYEVSGSDLKRSSTIEKLEKMGAQIFNSHAPQNIGNAQVVVLSSAVNKHNPEVLAAQQAKIPLIHRSEMLAELMRCKIGVVVVGTHGKTTTTSILASALTHSGLDPTAMIGGKINSFGGHAKLGKGDLFIAEGDESDGSFLKLNPTIAVVTNIDRDHLDHYGNLEEIIKAFERFIEKVPFYGVVCACIDDPMIQLILPKIRKKVITYGLRFDADISATNINFLGLKTKFTPVVFGSKKQEVTLHMPGAYNVVNSLATFAVAHILDVDLDRISHSISDFCGVDHRFTVIGEEKNKNTLIIDDYAHNPKKIATVLKGIKHSFAGNRILALFQPHRYSRLKNQFDEFTKCFDDADAVIVTPVYAAGEPPNPSVSLENLSYHIKTQSFHGASDSVYVAENLEHAAQLAYDMVDRLASPPSQGVVVITLGAGDVRIAGFRLLEKLSLVTK